MSAEYKSLLDAMSEKVFGSPQTIEIELQPDILNLLMQKTEKFRDKIKQESGYILTVEDTRKALEALEFHLQNKKEPKDLTEEQKALAKILIDTVILFNYGL